MSIRYSRKKMRYNSLHQAFSVCLANPTKLILRVVLCVAGCLQITRRAYNDKTSVDFAAYYGQGVIYAVLMRLRNDTSTQTGVAAYVPVVTYSCNFIDDHCARHG